MVAFTGMRTSGASAFARPTPHFENGRLSHKKRTITSHVPTAKTSGATGYVRPPANADKDGWPADMLRGAADD